MKVISNNYLGYSQLIISEYRKYYTENTFLHYAFHLNLGVKMLKNTIEDMNNKNLKQFYIHLKERNILAAIKMADRAWTFL